MGSRKIVQVSVKGGSITPAETGLGDTELLGVARDGSGLLVRVRNDTFQLHNQPMWWVPLPTGEPHQLGSLNATGADVLADGRVVFYKTTLGVDAKSIEDRTEWFIADKDGANPRELVSFPGLTSEVWAAPDGQRVLVDQYVNGNERLLEIAADGTGFREIRKIKDGECCFVWTPDEKYLAYVSRNDRQSDIWVLPMRTGLFRRPGKPIRLTNGPIPYSDPYPSPDGKQIFALGTKQRGELVRYDMQSHEFKPFLTGISATDVTFSNDGKWIAYASYPDHSLWRSRSDGTERKQLTFPPMRVGNPSISPDGTKVAFTTDKIELLVISMEGGPPQKIDEKGGFASWSPDGNYLYYQIGVSTGGGGIIADLRTGTKSLVPSSVHKFGYWLTQDALITSSPVVKNKFQTFDLKTREWTDFAPGILGDNVLTAQVSPDRTFLYFTTKAQTQRSYGSDFPTSGLKPSQA